MLKNPLHTPKTDPKKTARKTERLRLRQAVPEWLPEEVRLRLLRQVRRAGGRLTYTARFSRGERAALRHRKPVPVSEWSARHRILHMSAIPGRWHNDITPYLSGIMDASFFPGVEEIIQCKGPQSGGSEAVHNCIGYAADRRPGPTLYVFPDETTARENCTDRIIPMFEESPRLRELFTGKAEDRSAIRVSLANMPVYMAWSGSATRLANKPICYLVLDELDKFQNPKKEASSEDLAEARTTTFARRRKIWKISSPSDAESPIWRNFQKAQAKFDYWVRCPDCGGEQLMSFDRIRWEGGTKANPEEMKARHLAYYGCEICGSCWNDQTRNEAVKRGYWKARGSGQELFAHLKTHKPRSVGFHVPAWLSRFVSLSEIAADFVEFMQAKALGKPEWKSKMKDFMNKRKAEPWYDYEEQRTEDGLRRHCDDRPRGMVPNPHEDGSSRVATLLAGVDTQKGYFRYTVRAFGWGEEQESWLVQCGSLPTLEAVEKLLLQQTFRDGQGNEYAVERLLIDAMGHRTTEVYNFARKYRARVLATQGKQNLTAPLAYSQIDYFPQSKKPIPGGLKLGRVDTTVFKDALAAKLEVQPGDPGTFWLHGEKAMPRAYFEEMVTEYWDNDAKAWICPPGKPNHFWDCEVLCLAAAWELDIRRRRPVKEKQKSIPRPQPVPQAVKRVGMGSRPDWF